MILTEEAFEKYLQKKIEQGVSRVSVAKYRTHLQSLYGWLPKDKELTKERLHQWYKFLKDSGYSQVTVQKYVTDINTYLRAMKRPDLCLPKNNALDLRGQTFGYLIAIEPTEKRYRKDVVWKCKCKCGKEIEVPTTSLRSGNTTSCGCLNVEIFQRANQYFEGTSLRQSMEEKRKSSRNTSGFTGVSPKRDKWQAFITYKGVRYHLGVYSKLEDAVKARARGKELVMEDARLLLEEYNKSYKS